MTDLNIIARLFIASVLMTVMLSGCAGGDGEHTLSDRTAPEVEREISAGLTSKPNLAKLRAEEARILKGYRWIDRQAGIAAIPIRRAMELLIEREAFPVRVIPDLTSMPTAE